MRRFTRCVFLAMASMAALTVVACAAGSWLVARDPTHSVVSCYVGQLPLPDRISKQHSEVLAQGLEDKASACRKAKAFEEDVSDFGSCYAYALDSVIACKDVIDLNR